MSASVEASMPTLFIALGLITIAFVSALRQDRRVRDAFRRLRAVVSSRALATSHSKMTLGAKIQELAEGPYRSPAEVSKNAASEDLGDLLASLMKCAHGSAINIWNRGTHLQIQFTIQIGSENTPIIGAGNTIQKAAASAKREAVAHMKRVRDVRLRLEESMQQLLPGAIDE